MPDSAQLACFDDALLLPLGMFRPEETWQYRVLIDYGGHPARANRSRTLALWRMFAEHVGHDVRILGEETDWGAAYEFPRLPDDMDHGDITFEDYLDGWPPRVGPPTSTVHTAALVCADDLLALSLGSFDPAAAPAANPVAGTLADLGAGPLRDLGAGPLLGWGAGPLPRLGAGAAADPGERYLFGPDGMPSAENDLLNRAAWRILAVHVYHDVRVVEGVPDGYTAISDLEEYVRDDWPWPD